MRYEMENLLFRYRGGDENAIGAFDDDRLYFSSPDYFNDPFDSLAYVNKEKLIKSIAFDIDNRMREHILMVVDQLYSPVTSYNKSQIYEISKNVEFREIFFRDVLEKTEYLKGEITRNCKVICFSENCLSNLMWAHYANYHKGFVLGYAQDDIFEAKIFDENNMIVKKEKVLKKIKYSNYMVDTYNFAYKVLPIGGEIELDANCILQTMLTTKMSEWSYEQEWRVCSLPNNIYIMDPAHYISIVPQCVIFGARMSKLDREKLLKLAKKKKLDVFDVGCDSSGNQYKLKLSSVFSYCG